VHHFKRIDVLLNSAGVVSMGYTVTKNGETIENDEIWRLLKINVVGTVNVSKYVAKHMIDTADKSERVIINVASVAGIEASRGMMAYGMSKGAIIGITLPMARDLGRYNIRVVTVAP
jgi:NAD(P)-dependent dehydrogenase (short-subunit alcohol dehydrogenase family)